MHRPNKQHGRNKRQARETRGSGAESRAASAGNAARRPAANLSFGARRGLLALLLVAMFLPTVGTWLYFDVFAGSRVMQTIYSGTKVVQLALPLLAFLWIERRGVDWRPANINRQGDLAIGATFGALVAAGMFVLYSGWLAGSPLFASAPAMIGAKIKDLGLASPWAFLGFAIFLSVLHSLMEEFYFRWFIFRRLQAFVSVPWAIVLSSLAFMGHHVMVLVTFMPEAPGLAVVFSLCIAVGGAFWAWLYHRSGSLRGPWLSHFLVDCAIMWLGYRMVDWTALAG